jgi:hypothetical protein
MDTIWTPDFGIKSYENLTYPVLGIEYGKLRGFG